MKKGFDHWPEHDAERKSRSLCRNLGCKSLTRVYCTSCKIHLCFTTNRNCSRQFHAHKMTTNPVKPQKNNKKSLTIVNTKSVPVKDYRKNQPLKRVILIGKNSLRKRLPNLDHDKKAISARQPIPGQRNVAIEMDHKVKFMNMLKLAPKSV